MLLASCDPVRGRSISHTHTCAKVQAVPECCNAPQRVMKVDEVVMTGTFSSYMSANGDFQKHLVLHTRRRCNSSTTAKLQVRV